MSNVFALPIKKKFVVARQSGNMSQYLKKSGTTFAWSGDASAAIHFDDDKSAQALAERVAGGALVAEVATV